MATKPEPIEPKKKRGPGAPFGNQFWKARSTHGRRPIFSSPDQLWHACEEYFKWIDENPLFEVQPFAYQGKVKLQNVPKMRAMTLDGLCLFLDIARSTWKDYATQVDFSEICTRAEAHIRDQKLTGAAAGFLNPSIIARDLGLTEKTELSGPNGGAIPVKGVSSKRDVAKALALILAKGLKATPE